MIALGAAHSVSETKELEAWFAPLTPNSAAWHEASSAAGDYTAKNCGATARIVEALGEHLTSK